MGTEQFYTVRGYQRMEHPATGLTPSLEDYLEMITRHMRSEGYVRVSRLARELHVKPSSASKMLAKLAGQGYVDYEKYGVIRLTDKGREAGDYLLWRHSVVTRFFDLLCPEDGEKNFEEAEQVEHLLSPATVKRLERLLPVLQDFHGNERA